MSSWWSAKFTVRGRPDRIDVLLKGLPNLSISKERAAEIVSLRENRSDGSVPLFHGHRINVVSIDRTSAEIWASRNYGMQEAIDQLIVLFLDLNFDGAYWYSQDEQGGGSCTRFRVHGANVESWREAL